MIYKVLRDCHYVNRYWNEGELANFPNGTDNEHFEEVNGAVNPEVVVDVQDSQEEPNTMAAMNAAKKLKVPKTGMGYTIEDQKIANERTRAMQKPLPEPVKKKPGPKPKIAV